MAFSCTIFSVISHVKIRIAVYTHKYLFPFQLTIDIPWLLEHIHTAQQFIRVLGIFYFVLLVTPVSTKTIVGKFFSLIVSLILEKSW
jgi:hypothetical protein